MHHDAQGIESDLRRLADPPRPRFLFTAVVITVGAFLLRIYRIGAQELWADEAYSYLLAVAPEWLGLPTLAHNTPPLHHWLLRGWIRFAGEDEAALRLLSAVVGTLFVLAVVWSGRELFTPQAGIWGGAFAAVAPFHIYTSQEARTYALLTLMLTVTYGLLARAIRRDTVLWWSFAALAAAVLGVGLTGGTQFNTTVMFHAFNDNEQLLSANKTFRCWDDSYLTDINNLFRNSYLQDSTNHDLDEVFGASRLGAASTLDYDSVREAVR